MDNEEELKHLMSKNKLKSKSDSSINLYLSRQASSLLSLHSGAIALLTNWLDSNHCGDWNTGNSLPPDFEDEWLGCYREWCAAALRQ